MSGAAGLRVKCGSGERRVSCRCAWLKSDLSPPPHLPCSFSPLCIDAPTLRAGVAEGRHCMLAVLRAVLGDQLDFSRFEGTP